jgi:hypothetical protein
MSDPPSIWTRLQSFFKVTLPDSIKGNDPDPTPAKKAKTEPSDLGSQGSNDAYTLGQPARIQSVSVPLPTVDLVLGIDFGTSCTKVVIGDPGWKDRSYAISFVNRSNDISSWLYPTRFENEANLKMRFMEKPESESEQDLVACYLAGVIKCAQSWFTTNAPADYHRRTWSWSLNLGFPEKIVRQTTLSDAYRKVASVAVTLASLPEPPTTSLAAQVRAGKLAADPIMLPSKIQLYPEIAAQLAGYINSPFRTVGSLLLIDVGAGTLDVSTIIIHGNQDQDIVSFHVCEVEPLGALRLFQARVAALENVRRDCVTQRLEQYQDGTKPTPEYLEELVSPNQGRSSELTRAFENASKEFALRVVDVGYSCLAQFRRLQRDAHNSPSYDPWGRNLNFFLTGGGSRSSFYSHLFTEGPLEEKIIPFTRWHSDLSRRKSARQGLSLLKMPKPDKFENFPAQLSAHFDRLSVAYGLAFGGENLMKITAARR